MVFSQNTSPHAPGLLTRIRQSVLPEPLIPRSDAERKRYLFQNLILHFRPATVAEKTLNFRLTWGLGGVAAVLVTIQLLTGSLMTFVYEPTPVGAYASVVALQNEVIFGQLVRNIHYWSANILVLVGCLHLLRVFFTGAFHPPRQFTWIIGVGLLALVLLANFTGYLLPYDQLAYWAVTVSTGMLAYIPAIGSHLQGVVRGGTEIGPDTLKIFFALHSAFIPAGLVLLMAFHFWRIRKAGGLVVPRAPLEEKEEKPLRVPTLPNLLLREVVTALVLIAFVMVVALFFDAPLHEPANPGLTPNPTKAPWYFAGLQEILLHLHPLFAVFIIPVLLTLGLLGLPYLRYPEDPGGIWFASRTGRRMALTAVLAGLIVTPVAIIVDDRIIAPSQWLSSLPSAIGNGLIPTLIIAAAVAGFVLIMKKRCGASKNEAIQAVFVLLATAFVVLTLVGAVFRGPGMRLIWPG